MLGFMTASGHGLKYVLKADAAIGDIAANQEWFCKSLCIEFDKACKDAARISYCPSKEDILFINSEIFDYNNEEYDRQYGGVYRGETPKTITSTAGNTTSAGTNAAGNRPLSNGGAEGNGGGTDER